jgi:16S rRNA (cytosine967-C5)-methyltransferase
MKPSPTQLSALISALAAVLPLTAPADVLLRGHFRNEREIGGRDRHWVADAVYAILRHRARLLAVVPTATPRHIALAYLALFGGVSIRELASLSKPADGEWLAAAKAHDLATLSPAEQLELPEWLYTRLRAQYEPTTLSRIATALNQAAPFDLRVNTLKVPPTDAIAALAREGVVASATAWSPCGLRLTQRTDISTTQAFKQGLVEVQDEGSQLLAMLLQPRRSDWVVDFCAGAGGKTLLLGQMMDSKGRLYAFDVSEKRLANFSPRLKRSGLQNVHPQRIASENDPRVKRLAGKIDRVLVDAPCTGIGTTRRNPDLKWRQSATSLDELVELQQRILTAAAKLVKPGGRLVYGTCSLLAAENEQQIDRFLAANLDFVRVDARTVLTALRIHVPGQTSDYLQLNPADHGTDGFFAAILERRANAPAADREDAIQSPTPAEQSPAAETQPD